MDFRRMCLFYGLVVLSVASGCIKPDVVRYQDQKDLPWTPLRAFSGEFALPSLLVGNQEVPDPNCLNAVDALSDPAEINFNSDETKVRAVKASLKVMFEKYFVKAGIDSSLASGITEHISISASKVSKKKYIYPSDVSPNFGRATCSNHEAGWLTDDDRKVVVAGWFAKRIVIESDFSLTNEQKAAFDLAIQKIGTDLSVNFENISQDGKSVKISASNVFIGYDVIQLRSIDCRVKGMKLSANQFYDICKGRFKVMIEPSENPAIKDYTLRVNPEDGESASLDMSLNDGKVVPLCSGLAKTECNYLVKSLVWKQGDGYKADFRILFVAPSGK